MSRLPTLARVGVADVGVVPGPLIAGEGIGGVLRAERRPVIGDLREGADVIGDGAAVEEADGRENQVVVGAIRRTGRVLIRLRMRVAEDGHHRQRRHPQVARGRGLLVACGRSGGLLTRRGRQMPRLVEHRRKQGRAIRAAAIGVAAELEAAAVRREPRKLGVASAARLPGLPGEARQRDCGRKSAERNVNRSGGEPAQTAARLGRAPPSRSLRCPPIADDDNGPRIPPPRHSNANQALRLSCKARNIRRD